jgi:hypothetical protein
MSTRFKRVLFYSVGLAVMIAAALAAIMFLAWITNGWFMFVMMAGALGYLCTTVAIAYVNDLERKEAQADASS